MLDYVNVYAKKRVYVILFFFFHNMEGKRKHVSFHLVMYGQN